MITEYDNYVLTATGDCQSIAAITGDDDYVSPFVLVGDAFNIATVIGDDVRFCCNSGR